jgi:four helix bundle protein
MERKCINSVKDLEVYQSSYSLALLVFQLSKSFPKAELYSLTDQVLRSSRSVPANISEGFAKRNYKRIFILQLTAALGSVEETKTWLDLAKDCNYLLEDQYENVYSGYKTLGAMLYKLIQNWH